MHQNKNNIIDLRQAEQAKKEKSEEKEEISWQTAEFEYYPKNTSWHLAIGIILFGLFISLIILKNIFGAATILLFGVVIYIYATKKPQIVTVKINRRGVYINNKHIPYSNISSFWIHYEPPVKNLIIIVKESIIPKMIIPLGDTNPVKIREILLANAILEKEEEESLTEIIFRRIRF